MRIHFIAIGGAVMHNLALALHHKNYEVTGSDDEIREPSYSRLLVTGLLPESMGWFPHKITADLDAVILGMHARADNPELIRATELGIRVYSFPEFLYEQTKDKIRVVIAGSHGKTTTTAMIMHVLRALGRKFDYMVGSQLEGFDTMVGLSHDAPVAIFEGDEYLTSPLDRRPKFLWYKPHIAVITGIAWDHINVFPTFEGYRHQFELLTQQMAPNAKLIYFDQDEVHIPEVIARIPDDVLAIGYAPPAYSQYEDGMEIASLNGNFYKLKVFGRHNAANAAAALEVCAQLGISEHSFWLAMQSFGGTARRLQLLAKSHGRRAFLDFAHAPSKLAATIQAVKEQYPDDKLLACFELHTFSSLNADFLSEFATTMQWADTAVVYFDAHTLAHKKLPPIAPETLAQAFGRADLVVITNPKIFADFLIAQKASHEVLLLMSSGNFSNQNTSQLADTFVY
jgi:UDP-N-acetylmuramate: L-alanyl-gamma-D-glutamyl-meso-diaminopimelate ligase